jgi:hypothetical protein
LASQREALALTDSARGRSITDGPAIEWKALLAERGLQPSWGHPSPQKERAQVHAGSPAAEELIGEAADHLGQDLVPRRETAPRSCPGGPTPTPPEDQEIGHLLPVRPLVELPDDVADLAGEGQDPKGIPTRPWSGRVSDASRILPKTRGASVSAAWPPGELPDKLLDRLEVEWL